MANFTQYWPRWLEDLTYTSLNKEKNLSAWQLLEEDYETIVWISFGKGHLLVYPLFLTTISSSNNHEIAN